MGAAVAVLVAPLAPALAAAETNVTIAGRITPVIRAMPSHPHVARHHGLLRRQVALERDDVLRHGRLERFQSSAPCKK